MSCNFYPEWCDIIVDSKISYHTEIIKCPECGCNQQEEFNNRVMEYTSLDHYSVAHIPKSVYLTCSSCELDFQVNCIAFISHTSVEKLN